MYFRRVNWELLLRRRLWRPPKVFRGPLPTTNLRTFLPKQADLPGEPGAHFSFLRMNAERHELKFSNYGHREYDIHNFWSDNFLNYCDKFGLDHLGRADREGLGLLKAIPEPEYPDVVRAAALFESDWIGGNFSGGLLARAIRAQSVHRRVQGARESENPSSRLEPARYEVPSLLLNLVSQVIARAMQKLQKRAKKSARRLMRSSESIFGKPTLQQSQTNNREKHPSISLTREGGAADAGKLPTLIDCVLAVDEVDLALFRLDYMAPLVDVFVIGESPTTFSGEPRTLLFSEMKAAGQLPPNVIIEVIDIPPHLMEESMFSREYFVRNALATRTAAKFPGAIIMLQDVDEIPSKEQLSALRAFPSSPFVASIPMRPMLRRANWEMKLRARKLWLPPKAFRGEPPSFNMRAHPTRTTVGGEPGAHLSFLRMDAEKIQHKFSNYGHEEYNQAGVFSSEFLEYCDRFGLDHMGRGNRESFGLLGHIQFTQLPDVAKEAALRNPDWLGSNFEGSFFGRVVRAQFIYRYLSRPRTENVGHSRPWEPRIAETPLIAVELFLQVTMRGLSRTQRTLRRWKRRSTRLVRHLHEKIAVRR